MNTGPSLTSETPAGAPEATTAPAESEFSLTLAPHLQENFAKADQQLRERYGASPGIPALMRLWLACGTSSQITREFELAVMDIKQRTLHPNADGDFDEDSLF